MSNTEIHEQCLVVPGTNFVLSDVGEEIWITTWIFSSHFILSDYLFIISSCMNNKVLFSWYKVNYLFISWGCIIWGCLLKMRYVFLIRFFLCQIAETWGYSDIPGTKSSKACMSRNRNDHTGCQQIRVKSNCLNHSTQTLLPLKFPNLQNISGKKSRIFL